MEASPNSKPNTTGKNILLVDDHEQNLELLEAYLEGVGAELRLAKDGMEALRKVEERRPDLILLDVMMPRLSGYQVCRKLKGEAGTRGIPIIMVTALNEVSDVEKAHESGADGFLSKPINKQELVERVEAELGRGQRA
ncbi:response regulator [soil metagenome]